MARLVGIEPTLTVLETAVLPLYDSRIFADNLIVGRKKLHKNPPKIKFFPTKKRKPFGFRN
jgi:hypothetical protein